MADQGSASLVGTVWEVMYKAFGVNDDFSLCNWMANIGLFFTAVAGPYTFFNPAPYGRYGSTRFGPTINPKLAWIVQEAPAFVVPGLLIVSTPCSQLANPPNLIAISMFMIHYFHRSFIYPFALNENSNPTPVATILSAFIFCTYNGFLQGHHLINSYKIETSGLAECAGLVIFFLGMAINVSHDRMLIKLKKVATKNADRKTDYKIPRGYLFEYISGANYFGEMMEWWGLYIYTGGYPQAIFALFASTFLGIRAYSHHKFYKEKFGETYPSERKALIPFLL